IEKLLHVLAVDFLNVEPVGSKALASVFALGCFRRRIERDAVGIVNQDQIIEAPMTSERTCLGSDAFLHVAVTAPTEDVLIKNRVLTGVEAGRRHFRGRSNPNSIADSLPTRSRGAFHSGRVAKFRVSRRFVS